MREKNYKQSSASNLLSLFYLKKKKKEKPKPKNGGQKQLYESVIKNWTKLNFSYSTCV